MRIRVNFSKTEVIKYSSHLDLYRAWERWLRRAELPLTYSKGFKPHPHINLACALPLGFTSENDLVDIWLENTVPLDDIYQGLIHTAPPGISINYVEEIPSQTPSLQKQLIASEYIITLHKPVTELQDKINLLINSETIWRERNGKKYNLRPLILEITSQQEPISGKQQLIIKLKAQANATGRPDEILLSLGIDLQNTKIHRQKLILDDNS